MLRNRILIMAGIFAPIIYAGTVVVGGIIRPDYSHIAQPVSDLIASGAPNKALLDPLFGLYNLLTLVFGLGLLQRVRAEVNSSRKTLGTIGAIFLFIEGLAGFITLLFPEDSGSIAEATTIGKLHVVCASISAFTSILTILFMAFWFRSVPDLRRLSLYSFISVLIVFVFGGLAAASVANHSPVGGLMERVTIGGFIQWLLVVALTLYATKAIPATPAPRVAHSR